jgi:hypothetical protein
MKLHQLSLFLENRPKQLRMPAKVLHEAGVNILTMSLADTQQFGILRLIVSDWNKGKKVLEENDCVVNVTEVIAIEVPDKPGGMDDILAVIEDDNLNIEYMYSYTFKQGERAALIFRFEDIDQAIKAFQGKGINVVDSADILDQS